MFSFHPAADAFPLMDNKRYAELIQDIRVNGQLEEITLCDGMVLDGRNRYRACVELSIEPRTRDYGGDPWAYAWSLNGMRRDLVDEQRYLIWKYCSEQSESFLAEKRRIADEANRKRSEATKEQHEISNPRIGEIMVGGHCVRTPENKDPERKAKAAAAKVNLGAVARGDKLAKDRPDLAAAVRKGEMRPAEAHREMKKAVAVKNNQELPDGKYGAIYADPPWSYNDKCDSGAVQSGGAEKHYPSMPLSELKLLGIPTLANENAVLFLWATCPLLEDALELCRAWGFRYKAQFVWDKVRHNMGHYNSVRHELLLICTRGSATPEVVKLFDSVQSIEKKEHSQKPEEFRDIINTLYPSWKKIELFRRGDAIEGWDVWGNEST